jgi:molybdopterin synthase catalytic subunit
MAQHPNRVNIQTADFDPRAEFAVSHAASPQIGAIVTFIGTVRDATADQSVTALEIEHYPGMTERAIEAMIDDAHRRFEITSARIVHRVGLMQPAEQIVMVAVTSIHRHAAFLACEFLMDCLKTQAPFWKKEHTPLGPRWVQACRTDDAAWARWGIRSSEIKL